MRLGLSVTSPRAAEGAPGPAARGELRTALVLGLATLVFCWGVLAFVPTYTWQTGDIRFYARWGGMLARHLLPYRDFPLEYPPGSLLSFAVPEYLRRLVPASYAYWFRLEVLALWVTMLCVTGWTLRRLAVPRNQMRIALVLGGAFPLLLGPISIARYDVWPALLTALAVAALVARRGVLACALIAAGVVVKLYPGVLLPIALVVLWRRSRWRGVLEGAGVSLLVGLAGFGLFLAEAPQGLWHGLWRQLSRPLQVESSGASLWALAHVVAGVHVGPVVSYGSDNIVTPGANLAASLSSIVVALALVAVWVRFARSAGGPDEIVLAATAAVTGYLAFGKVFSPQYLVWLLPLVVLLRGRLGQRATALFVVIVVLTQVWEPYLYWQLLHYRTLECLLLVARNGLVVGLFALLALPAGEKLRLRASVGSRPSGTDGRSIASAWPTSAS